MEHPRRQVSIVVSAELLGTMVLALVKKGIPQDADFKGMQLIHRGYALTFEHDSFDAVTPGLAPPTVPVTFKEI